MDTHQVIRKLTIVSDTLSRLAEILSRFGADAPLGDERQTALTPDRTQTRDRRKPPPTPRN